MDFIKLYREYLKSTNSKNCFIDSNKQEIYKVTTPYVTDLSGEVITKSHFAFKLIKLNENLNLNCMLNTSNTSSEIMYSNKVITQRSTNEMTNIMQCMLAESIKANSYFLFHSMRVLHLTKAIQYGKLLCEMLSKG